MRILVTGAAGFIGSHIVEYHLNKGDEICGIDNFHTGSESNIHSFLSHPNFHFIQDDILTWSDLEKFTFWADRIYHMAAIVGVYKVLEEPDKVLAVNIAGAERVLQAVSQQAWKTPVLLASSAEIYGPNKQLPLVENANPILESAARNRWHYAISKLANEAMGLAYYEKHGTPVVTVRLFNTVGPRQTGRYGMVIPNFVHQAQNHEAITVFGTGNQTRSFCDVRDTVVMLDLLMESKKAFGEIVNVGNNREICIQEVAKLVKTIVNPECDIQNIPYIEAYGEHYIDIQRRQPALFKLFDYIEFQYRFSLEETIKTLAGITR